MNSENIFKKISTFVEKEMQQGKKASIYKKSADPFRFFKTFNIKVELDKCKKIILQEETGLELGGINKKSFSLVYPTKEIDELKDGKIALIGPEMKEMDGGSVDFGMLLLIGATEISEKDWDNFRQFNFVSNGIEGFSIRTIPRRFWCRISAEILKKKFSFEFLGNAIMYLYKQKFKSLIDTMELLFINSYPDVIDEFVKISSEISEEISSKWKDKVEDWRKKIDCDYGWDCKECPYRDTCEEVKKILYARKEIEN